MFKGGGKNDTYQTHVCWVSWSRDSLERNKKLSANTAALVSCRSRLLHLTGIHGFTLPYFLQVTANDAGSQMSGWLHRRSRRSWKRFWFVLKKKVLYVYKASEDIVALDTLAVLGYSVEQMKNVSVFLSLFQNLVILLLLFCNIITFVSDLTCSITVMWFETYLFDLCYCKKY